MWIDIGGKLLNLDNVVSVTLVGRSVIFTIPVGRQKRDGEAGGDFVCESLSLDSPETAVRTYTEIHRLTNAHRVVGPRP